MNLLRQCLCLLLLTATIDISAQSIITDRPDQTESSSTIDRGSLQIESGVLAGFEGEDKSEFRQLLAPTNLFRYGITKGIELRFLNQLERIKQQVKSEEIIGISDLEIGTKIQVVRNENVNTEIAVLSHAILPTGSSGLTNDKVGSISKICLSHELSDEMGVGYNVGYNYFGEGNGDLTYSLALGISISDDAAIYVESYGEVVDIEAHLTNFDAGITYLVKENLQLDFSFGTGINHTMNYISAGFSWIIHKESETVTSQ